MELGTVQKVVENTPKGANIICEWVRQAKVLKGCAHAIDKHVRMVGRCGIDYDKQAAVIAKRENGDLPEQSQPIWHGAGEWAIFPFLIRHKKTGQLYLRLYNGTSAKVPVVVEWLMDGDVVSYETVEPFLLASEKNDDKGDCFCCKIEDLIRIGNEADWLSEVEDGNDEGVAAVTGTTTGAAQVPAAVPVTP